MHTGLGKDLHVGANEHMHATGEGGGAHGGGVVVVVMVVMVFAWVLWMVVFDIS